MASNQIDVYELECPSARAAGWDLWVCRSIKEVTDRLEFDLDGLEEESEPIVIRFKRYTPAQMEDVVYD